MANWGIITGRANTFLVGGYQVGGSVKVFPFDAAINKRFLFSLIEEGRLIIVNDHFDYGREVSLSTYDDVYHKRVDSIKKYDTYDLAIWLSRFFKNSLDYSSLMKKRKTKLKSKKGQVKKVSGKPHYEPLYFFEGR